MKTYKRKPLKLGKGGTPLVLTSSGKAWLVNKSKKAKACDGDVRSVARSGGDPRVST